MFKNPSHEKLQKRIRRYEKKLTELNHARRRLERLNRVLMTIRRVDLLTIQEKNRQRLLHGVCEALVENRGYDNAWIALWDGSWRPTSSAESGLGQDFNVMVERFNRGEMTACSRKALAQPGVFLSRRPFVECPDCPLSTKYDGRSALTVRMENNGVVYGILSVSIPVEFAEDPEEHELLGEVAGDIAFALRTLELEEEHAKVDEALCESEQRFRDLIENSLVGISILQNGRVLYQNPEQERLLGPLPRPPKLAETDGIHPDDIQKVTEFYQEISSTIFSTREIEFRFSSPDAAVDRRAMKCVHCRASAFVFRGKKAVLINMMDVTRLKELENSLMIQDKMSSLGRVAAGIAHEIRNPLSGINIYLNTLEKLCDREQGPDKAKQIIRQIQSASGKIEAVIRRVMDFSKPSEPEFVSTDLNKPIDEAVNLSAVTLRKRKILLEKILAPDMPAVRADPRLLEQVILNLITNAAEAMKNMRGDKRMEITSSVEGRHVIVKISDSGPGVALHLRDKIFDPFYTTKNGSTGIGLSLSHRIIADHGGSLEVSSSSWGGAEFKIRIPLQ